MDRSSDDGFTLIELMVVVLIIAILLAIAVPTYLGARSRANDRAVQSNLRNARLCAQGDPGYRFGLEFSRFWSYEEIVALLAERVGTSPDLGHIAGPDTIDPWKCVQRLSAMADRLGVAAQ